MNLTLIAGFSGAAVALIISVIGWIYSNGKLAKELENRGKALADHKKRMDIITENTDKLKSKLVVVVSKGEERLETISKCLESIKVKFEQEQRHARTFVTRDTCSDTQRTICAQFADLKQLLHDSETKREKFNSDLVTEIRELYKYLGENGVIDRRRG